MTTSTESGLGSFRLVNGLILNNQLTDFGTEQLAADGAPIANSIAAGKRPRSSMAPTLVFDRTPRVRAPRSVWWPARRAGRSSSSSL